MSYIHEAPCKAKILTPYIYGPTFDSTESRLFLFAARRGELSYLAPIRSEKISAPYFSQCFFRGLGGGGVGDYPQAESNTTPPSPKTEITNILFYILNFASVIKFKL
jgi:hypothetical protein